MHRTKVLSIKKKKKKDSFHWMTKEALNAVRLSETKYKSLIKNNWPHIYRLTITNTLNTCLADKEIILKCIFEDTRKKKARGRKSNF